LIRFILDPDLPQLRHTLVSIFHFVRFEHVVKAASIVPVYTKE
jgi:hypothetical protein